MKIWSILLGSLLMLSCSEDHPIPNINTMPASFTLIVLDKDGNNLIKKNTPSNLVYSYNKEGKKSYTNSQNGALIQMFYDSTKYKYYYGDMGMSVSSMHGERTFFLDFAGKVDTIYFDVEKLSPADAKASNGLYYFKEVLINGVEAKLDETLMPPVYVIRRK